MARPPLRGMAFLWTLRSSLGMSIKPKRMAPFRTTGVAIKLIRAATRKGHNKIFMLHLLLRSENSISRIAETRHNIGVLV